VKGDLCRETGKDEEYVESRVDFQPPSNEESLETNRMAFLVLAEKQAGNQETAQDEKKVHTYPSYSCEETGYSCMMDHYCDDGNAAEYVQPFISHLQIRPTKEPTTGWKQKSRSPNTNTKVPFLVLAIMKIMSEQKLPDILPLISLYLFEVEYITGELFWSRFEIQFALPPLCESRFRGGHR
jgi:hypothetical protein